MWRALPALVVRGLVVRRQGGAKEENIASSSAHSKPMPPGMGVVWA